MKNYYKFFFCFVLLSIIINTSNSFAGDRLVFIERYTSSTCGPCASANPTLDAFLNTSDPSKVTSLSYHMNWPAPGNDPMYLFNPADNNARRNYYGVNAIPHWRIDGTTIINTGNITTNYGLRRAILSPVTVIVTHEPIGSDSVRVHVKIFCEDLLPDPSVTVHISVVEREIQYGSPPGTNGESHFLDVMRKMLPTGTGTKVNLFPGALVEMTETFYIDPIYVVDKIEPLVFVQAGDREILNAGIPTYDFTLLSDYAFRVVDQGQNGSANYQISVPVVDSGYSSPVSLTAEIQPPTAGVSASFTGGSTINSFPGSVTLNVNSNSSVPTGTYKVIVTGTNALNDTHKVVVSYLVGKNYVLTGTNRSQLNYTVDGNNYSTLRVFNWDINSSHTLSVTTPQTVGNTRYIFENWSNGNNNTSQTINVNSGESNYIANFKSQYKFTAFTNPGGLPVTITHGNEFLDSGFTGTISVTPTQVTHNGQVYYFKQWIGGGNGSYTGTNSSFQLTNLSNPISGVAIYDTVVSISQIGNVIPDKYELYQNYPNPFNPETNIKFDIPKAGNISLTIYNMLGEEVANLYNGFVGIGRFETSWNASSLSSGVYFYKLESDDFVSIKKLVLLK